MPIALPKRLIEVDLPIKRISAHARREKSIRHGHLSTLHIWWARRPLAACRAVICAALWPDPADENCPAEFRAIAADLMYTWARENAARGSAESAGTWTTVRQHTSAFAVSNHPTTLRHALLDFIADFADWDNSTVAEYLATARTLTAAANWALGQIPPEDKPPIGWPGLERWSNAISDMKRQAEAHPRPLVVDPFAGGGSIPLEALRVGADAFASDLNPVPVLLNKVVLEYIPKYGRRLADEVRTWGEWIKNEALKTLEQFYPAGEDGGTPIAYIWARTILSNAPSAEEDPIEVPLISSMWLSKKPHRGRALRWVRDSDGNVMCDIVEKIFLDGRHLRIRQPKLEVFEPSSPADVGQGTVKRGSATCPVTGFTTQVSQVRLQLQTRRGGTADARLLCIVSTRSSEKGRFYKTPTQRDIDAIRAAESTLNHMEKVDRAPFPLIPHEEISLNEIRRISIPIYGMSRWGDAFSRRQLLTLVTLAKLVREAGAHCARANPEDDALSQAVQTLLAINVGKAADYGSALATWSSPASQETVRSTFSRQAIGMVWDYAEANPFAASSGGWSHNLGFVDRLIESVTNSKLAGAHVEQASACVHPLANDSAQAVITDPPYYDAVPYAHLSDFFYVWLRRAMPSGLSSLFAADSVPKSAEIVVDRPHYLSTSDKGIAFYERELTKAFGEARRVVAPDGIGTIVFASKTTASWEAILKAVIEAGWIITGSWPIDTEREGRMAAIGQARLASSVHLVCRPREGFDGTVGTDVGDWRDVLQELPRRIHEWMPRLAEEGVVGADAIFACLGPALEIFSRYSRVEKANGDLVALREYLEHVWAAVSREALSTLISDTDLSALESDARITAMWLWTLNAGKTPADAEDNQEEEPVDDDDDVGGGRKTTLKAGYSLEYDAARKIAQGLGASLEDLTSVIEVSGDEARLLAVSERTAHLFGKEQAAAPEPAKRGKKKVKQMDLFAELVGAEPTQTEAAWEEKTVSKAGATVLDRVHQSMILFATGRGDALKRFLVEDGIGQEANFWKLAQALSALYPATAQEKRWVDGVLARKKGLGL